MGMTYVNVTFPPLHSVEIFRYRTPLSYLIITELIHRMLMVNSVNLIHVRLFASLDPSLIF